MTKDRQNKAEKNITFIIIVILSALLIILLLKYMGGNSYTVASCEKLPNFDRDECYFNEALYRDDIRYCEKALSSFWNSYCISSITNRYSGDAGFPG